MAKNRNGNGTETTAVATTTAKPPATIKGWLESDHLRKEIAKVLPKHLTSERFMRVAITATTRTPELRKCDQATFFRCLLDLGQLGLEPDGRRAHLIPFRNNKRNCMECQLIIDYKGLVELAMRSGQIANIHADVVRENDVFDYDRGIVEKHKIDFRHPRGNVYAAYSLVRFKDGTESCEVMGFEEIEAVRKRSRAGNSGPWVTDWPEMAKKTVFRRHSKWLPLSAEFRDALDKDVDVIDLQAEPSRPVASSMDDLAEQLETEQGVQEPESDDVPFDVNEETGEVIEDGAEAPEGALF